MKVLVVLNEQRPDTLRVLIQLRKKTIKNRVAALMDRAKGRDALSLVMSEGVVDRYLPPGQKLRMCPDLTLIEDLL